MCHASYDEKHEGAPAKRETAPVGDKNPRDMYGWCDRCGKDRRAVNGNRDCSVCAGPVKLLSYNKVETMSHDPVNHPSHYTSGKIEVIDFIDDQKLGFALGNAVKYIARAGKKDPAKTLEDLKKARWYLDHHIKMLEGKSGGAE